MSDDIKIYGKLTNATTDNVLAGADLIYDSYLKQFLQDINKLIPKLESDKIPSKYLPSYVDDVLEGKLIDIRTFETTGKPLQTGVIYLDTETNISYRWSGSQYVKISSPLELGTTEDTALKGSLGINTTDVSRTGNSVDISLIKYSGNQIGIHIPSATLTVAGVMSAEDKASLATLVTTVDIGYNLDSVDVNLLTLNSNPIESNIEAATITKAGVMSATDKTKLDTLDWYFEE